MISHYRCVTQPYQNRRLARVYQRGNEMPPTSVRAWVDVVTSFGPAPEFTIDVGTGTGMFAAALAELPGSKLTIGVDPSAAMLAEARRFSSHPRVRYVAGEAGALPARSRRFDLALLSRVIHHLPDRRPCVASLRRIVRPGGIVVVRTTVRERLDALVYRYWPQLHAADRRRFPAESDVVRDFEDAGFATTDVTSVALPVHSSLGAYYEAMAACPQSKFDQLSGAEFDSGLAALRRDADSETDPQPIAERYDVLAFRG